MFAAGTRALSEERAVKLRTPVWLVPRDTVNDTAFGMSSGVIWLEITEIVGPKVGTL